MEITNFNEESRFQERHSRIAWHRKIPNIEAIGFMSYTRDLNLAVTAWLSGMGPSESGEAPVKGNWISEYIVEDYFPSEMLFSPGDNIALDFRVTRMTTRSYVISCSSVHYTSNGSFAEDRWMYFSDRDGVTYLAGNLEGVNVTVQTSNTPAGTSRLVRIQIYNATEQHIGQYECQYFIRRNEGVYGHTYMKIATGARLLPVSREAIVPFMTIFKMGYDSSRAWQIKDEVTIPAGIANMFRCYVIAQHFPVNVSLYFRDEQMSLSEVYNLAAPSYYSMGYGHRFSEVTTADAGVYTWLIETADEVIEKEIHVSVDTDTGDDK